MFFKQINILRQDAKEPIKIGILNDQSGVYSAATGMGFVVAAKMVVEDAGDVLGSEVQVMYADHQFKPEVSFLPAEMSRCEFLR